MQLAAQALGQVAVVEVYGFSKNLKTMGQGHDQRFVGLCQAAKSSQNLVAFAAKG